MVTLNVHASNFRISATSPATLSSPVYLRVWSTTKRTYGAESPAVAPLPHLRNVYELKFPDSWKLSLTERLPDLLALRAAALHIVAYSTPKQSRFKRFAIRSRRKCTEIGGLRLGYWSLATGTVCHSLPLLGPKGETTSYTLAFDIVVEESARVSLSFAPVRVTVPAQAERQAYSITLDHIGGRSSRLSQETFPEENDDEVRWDVLPPLPLNTSNLSKLTHGAIRVTVRRRNADGIAVAVAQTTVQVHQFWAALAHPGNNMALVVDLADGMQMFASVSADRLPPTGQMIGGVTTEAGVTGARSVIFGTPIADRLHIPPDSGLPPGWVRLVDSFGYRYYRHVRHAVEVWTMPPDETTSAAIKHDEEVAEEYGFSQSKHGVFRSNEDSTETWIHPAATRISMSTYHVPNNSSSNLTRSGGVDHDASLASVDMADLQPAPFAFTRSAHKARVMSDLHPAMFTHLTASAKDADSSRSAVTSRESSNEIPRGRIVEMKWSELPIESKAPGVKCEGHTLTTVNGGKTLLKFGGSTGSGGRRLNTLDAFDIETSTWTTVKPSGVLPAARTGHGAVALGADQSRLLIFGGSSPEGRRNDLHMFHVANKTWSPVICSGTPPEVRVRLGMTVTSDGSTALVFGGRSIYRFLGGEYYDALYVNAFHAERSQWVQMRPQGSGPRPAPRSGCVVEFINQRHMFVHGGYDDGDRFFDDTFLFDMVSSSWQKVAYPNEPRGPTPRESHASTVLDGKVVVYGGDSRNGLLSDLHMFDSGTMRWDSPSVVGASPGRLCGSAMAAVGPSEALLVGGDTGFMMSRSVFKLNISRRSTIDAESMKELAMERGPDAGSCVVCMDANVQTIFLWCGHSVCCKACSKLVKHICPVCRQPFSEIVYNMFDG